ncbi:hypothetical protein IFVP177_C1320201 [Vibrio parahaemolyticus]
MNLSSQELEKNKNHTLVVNDITDKAIMRELIETERVSLSTVYIL